MKKKKKFLAMKATPYSIINGFLYKFGLDEVLRRYVLDHERQSTMHEANYGLAGGHFQSTTTAKKIQQLGLWWPILYRNFQRLFSKCDCFQRLG